MAIKDTTKKPYIVDRDDKVFVGIDLPFRKSQGREGWFASSETTIEAVKNNIKNLVQTQQGERFFQPFLDIKHSPAKSGFLGSDASGISSGTNQLFTSNEPLFFRAPAIYKCLVDPPNICPDTPLQK